MSWAPAIDTGLANLCLIKKYMGLYTNVWSYFIHSNPKLETKEEWTDELQNTHANNTFGIRKQEMIDTNGMNGSPKHLVELKKQEHLHPE